MCVLALLLVLTGNALSQSPLKLEMTEASQAGEAKVYDIHVECPINCMKKVRIEAKGHKFNTQRDSDNYNYRWPLLLVKYEIRSSDIAQMIINLHGSVHVADQYMLWLL